ncbi:MAG: AlwI family type II restriction endonuclease, partial [Planctomycetes bacterium]|nr:AlwI family type II restriction endonuclease [Planctomycetota bacterium]
ETKKYNDPPHRGRESINPLKKLGFTAIRDNKVKITNLGGLFISPDANINHIFFKSLLKLQFPNPTSAHFSRNKGFNVRPFIAVMHLMKKTDGLSQEEFSLFVPTLTNFRNIDTYSDYIFKRRKLKTSKIKNDFDIKFIKSFYETNTLTKTQWKNLFEYGDNTMRYFRLTKYFRVETHTLGQWRIKLEPSRIKEIEQLLSLCDGSAETFGGVDDYIEYLSDIRKPKLPWEVDSNKSKDIIVSLLEIVSKDFESLNTTLQAEVKEEYNYFVRIELDKLNLKEIEKLINDLRSFRLKIIQIGRNTFLRRNLDELKKIINLFKDRRQMHKIEPVEFEYMISQCLKILNDEIEIKPNCILDDDGNPIGFAPGNKPDIEGYYNSFNGIFEVTLDTSRAQVYRESIPIMRHLKNFENDNSGKPAFCIFIAPKVHDDTINYLWISVKHGFEGRKQKIVAFDLNNFVRILEFFIEVIEQAKPFNHQNIEALFNSIVSSGEREGSSVDWFRNISSNIAEWETSLI